MSTRPDGTMGNSGACDLFIPVPPELSGGAPGILQIAHAILAQLQAEVNRLRALSDQIEAIAAENARLQARNEFVAPRDEFAASRELRNGSGAAGRPPGARRGK